MKIGLYAYDVGPSKNLAKVRDVAENAGHTVVWAPTQATLSTEQLAEFASCDIVATGLCSISSVLPDAERLLLDYVHKTTPFVVIEDVPGTSLRPLMKGYTHKVASVFVARKEDISETKAFGYDDVRYIGPPPHWKDTWDALAMSSVRADFRKVDRAGTFAPIVSDDVIIFFNGTKESQAVNNTLAAIANAVHALLGDRFVIGFKPHPGEEPKPGRADFAEAHARYRELMKEREVILNGAWVADFGEHKNDVYSLLRSVDIPVFSGGATDSIIMAYRNMPAIYYTDDSNIAGMKDQIAGSAGKWFVAELGGMLKAEGAAELREAIATLLSPEGRDAFRKQQAAAFPAPDDWDTAPKIVAELESIVNAREDDGYFKK